MLTIFFHATLILMVVMKRWLAARQIRSVSQHRTAVPEPFQRHIPLESHQRAADYTIARVRLARIEMMVDALVFIALTWLGGLQWLAMQWAERFGHGYIQQIALIASVIALLRLIDLPFEAFRHFVVEQRFGFNRMTKRLFVIDVIKESMLGMALGAPLLFSAIALMTRTGPLWWLWLWSAWVLLSGALMVLYPLWIAPLFNTFEPLRNPSLITRINALLKRCQFAAQGLFVMDSSRRSAHGNAYFTGFGKARRIVFYDTLLKQLTEPEIEAVLAHELGHFKRRHIAKRLITLFTLGFTLLALLGALAHNGAFYQSLGVSAERASPAIALILFSLITPIFLFFLKPINSWISRAHEFEADAFAAEHSDASALANALIKLYKENASTLTPDPIYSAFYDSHPSITARLARLPASGRPVAAQPA